MKLINTIIAITFSLITFSATAHSKLTDNGCTDLTVNNTVKMNTIDNNGVELTFKTGINGFYIKWQTSNESNTSRFELQVTDGSKSFKTIRTVAASDVTEWSTSYETKFIRNYVSAENVYYRLKTVFNNGTEVYTAATSFEIPSAAGISYANVR